MKILLHFSYIRFRTIEFKNSIQPFIQKIKLKKNNKIKTAHNLLFVRLKREPISYEITLGEIKA